MDVLNRKLLRNLWSSKGQSVAVAMVVLCGVSSLVCILSAYRSLRLTRDAYYERYRFADFWLPLEKAPAGGVQKVEALSGVLRAQGRIVKDVSVDVEGKVGPCTGRVISLPHRQGGAMNDIHLLSGRYFSPGVRNEVILSASFARANGLRIGDHIRATMNDRKQPLRIIGTALSPEYVYSIRSAREFLPSPENFGLLWLTQDFAEMALGMQEAVNEIVGFLDQDADEDAVLESIEDLMEPYGALTAIHRKDQLSNRYLSDEIKGLGASAKITPSIFLGIAAMILMVMLDRVVHRERTQIGVLKACGYANFTIAWHYMKFGLVLSVAGSAFGFLLGQWLARAMMGMYVEFFEFPILRHRFYPDVLLISLGISVLAGALGSSLAVASVVRIQPAQAMRPPAPLPGHRILLERSALLWRNVSFIDKMVLRNIFRNKIRACLTIFGVMCATAILLLGYFGGDSMDYLINYQFQTLQRQDVRVDFHTARGKGAYLEAMRFPHVRAAEPQLIYPFTLKAAWRKKDAVVTGLPAESQLVSLETVDGNPIRIGESGLVLSEYLADELRVARGDHLVMKPLLGKLKREVTVPVRAVVQQYLGIGAYMNIRALSRVLEESMALNSVLLRVDREGEEALNRYLKDLPGVASVEIKKDSQSKIEETLAKSMAISNTFLTFFAGVIAFAIIYNSTAISLSERTRELASLRVLGFRLGELRRIVLGENVLLAAVGAMLGVPFGLLMCRWMIEAYDTDLYRFPFHVGGGTYVATALSIAVFVTVANLASRRRIARLDMVEVLKAME